MAFVVVERAAGFRLSTPPVVDDSARRHPSTAHNAERTRSRNISAAERFRYLNTEEELKGWVAPIHRLAEQADRVHVLMINCYGDYGVRNAPTAGRADGEVKAYILLVLCRSGFCWNTLSPLPGPGGTAQIKREACRWADQQPGDRSHRLSPRTEHACERATEEEMLNRIAAIQAAAEILDDNQELCHGDRRAFLTVIQTETARLQALVRTHSIFVRRLPCVLGAAHPRLA